VARAARFDGLRPSSAAASSVAAAASRKTGTVPELVLRRSLRRLGLSCQLNRSDLPGVPDIVLAKRHVVVFVDGDFWHGKDWERRKVKLMAGHNAAYWINKIEGNRARDRDQNRQLRSLGWTVMRFWESDVLRRTEHVVKRIQRALVRKRPSVRRKKGS
jgi:DNA mismatch endonuclease, patch repair protein